MEIFTSTETMVINDNTKLKVQNVEVNFWNYFKIILSSFKFKDQ